MTMVGGVVGGGYNGSDGRGSAALSTSSAAVAAAVAAAAAAAAHVPAPWFPRLVNQMERRKNETTQNLIKSQEKVH